LRFGRFQQADLTFQQANVRALQRQIVFQRADVLFVVLRSANATNVKVDSHQLLSLINDHNFRLTEAQHN